jgi:hypothetical protein
MVLDLNARDQPLQNQDRTFLALALMLLRVLWSVEVSHSLNVFLALRQLLIKSLALALTTSLELEMTFQLNQLLTGKSELPVEMMN